MSDPDLVAELEGIERQRLRLLVAAHVEQAATFHADDFQLVTPQGAALSKAEYLHAIAAGDIDYRRWEAGPIAVRGCGDAAVIRYRAEMEMAGLVSHLWHTDVYERREGRWQVVWSHATRIVD